MNIVLWGNVMRNGMRWAASLAASAAIFAVCGAAWAQEVVGEWRGTLTAPGGTLRVGLTVTAKPGGGYEGTLTSPDQTPMPLPLDEVKLEGGVLTFSMAAIQGGYSGRWDAGRSAWVGQWTQLGASLPLVLTSGKP